MSAAFARREIVLAAIALLGALIALAVASARRDGDDARRTLPKAVSVPGVDWYRAYAAPYPVTTRRVRTSCGHRLGPTTRGVAHPVLPCGVKVYIAYGEETVLTQVIDRGPRVPGREFDVTRPLASAIGLDGTRAIRWRYASADTR